MEQPNPTTHDDEIRRHQTPVPYATGEPISRASSRSSNTSNASRSAYPGVPDNILDHIDEARAARDQALADWNSARQDPNITQTREAELGSEYLDAQQELDRAKHQRRLFYVGRPTGVSTGTTTPQMAAPTPLRAVSERPEIHLEEREEPGAGSTQDRRASVSDEREEGGGETRRSTTYYDQQDRSRAFTVPIDGERNTNSDNSSNSIPVGALERALAQAMQQLGQDRGEQESLDQYLARMRAFDRQHRTPSGSAGVYRPPHMRGRTAEPDEGSADADNEREAPNLVPPNVTQRRGRSQRNTTNNPTENDT
ncbi:hypothetical protein K435DRAFT_798700 [Dendrothele bispora CBS 962.96]|uniref:Uncharacterized protein n=1 Tax=Dendrothele bispora (strain CBS 962.96) TaxID=1314807 RepID=A0A4S8LZK3_DENBC|nr:hypothetical protein K435DRAFT_798700 [Dendrothele bispora CBS 962.96]